MRTKLNAFARIFTVIALLSVRAAFAGDAFVPVPMNEFGEIYVQGSRVFAKFQDGSTVALGGMRVGEIASPGGDDGDGADSKPKVPAILFDGKAPKAGGKKAKGEVVSVLSESPAASAGPLAGIKVLRIGFPDGSMGLVWVAGRRTSSVDKALVEGGVHYLLFQKVSPRSFQAVSFQARGGGVPDGYPNVIGIHAGPWAYPGVSSSYTLFIYDKWSGKLEARVLMSKLDSRKPGAFRTFSDFSSQSTLLSQHFTPDRPFEETASLYWRRDNAWYGFVKSPRGDVSWIGSDPDAEEGLEEGDLEGQTDSLVRNKSSSRFFWLYGMSPILGFFEQEKVSKSLIQFGSSLSSLDLDREFDTAMQEHRKDESSGKTEARAAVLLLTASDVVRRSVPGLRHSVFRGLLDPSATLGRLRNGERVAYVRLPSADSSTGEVVQALVTQARASGRENEPSKGPLWIMVDAFDADTSRHVDRLADFLNVLEGSVTDDVARRINVVAMVSSRQRDQFENSDFNQSMVGVTRYVSIDQYLSQPRKIAILSALLGKQGHELKGGTISSLYDSIMRESFGNSWAASDLSRLARELGSLLTRIGGKEGDPSLVPEVTKLYKQISGERKVGPFSHEALQRAQSIPTLLSRSYPAHSRNAVSSRDDILATLRDRVLSWFAYGHKERPLLPFFFLGDNGTGKTMLSEGLVEVLGAVTETVNVSARSDDSKEDKKSDFLQAMHNWRLLQTIQNKIDRLVLDPNPIKILVLDEVHANAALFKILLSALGNGDRKAGVLNLDGIIVVLIANVDTESAAYEALRSMKLGDPEYSEQLTQLVKDSFGEKKKKDDGASAESEGGSVDKKVLGALSGRILSNMFFFPPIELGEAQQTDLIRRTLGSYETKNKMRLVIQEAAMGRLAQVATSHRQGNYRSVERALHDEIEGAFGRYLSVDPTRGLQGYFVLTVSSAQPNELSLVGISRDNSGLATLVQESLSRYQQSVKHSLAFALETLRSEAKLDSEGTPESFARQALIRSYEQLAAGFRDSSDVPLFTKNERTGELEISPRWPELKLPGSIPFTKQTAIKDALLSQVKALFDSARFGNTGGREYFLAFAGKIHEVLATMTEVHGIGTRAPGGGGEYADWVKASARLASAANAQPGEGTFEAVAFATGGLLNTLAGASASLMLKEIELEAKQAREARSKAAEGGKGALSPGQGGECMRLLSSHGEAAAKRVKGLLGE